LQAFLSGVGGKQVSQGVEFSNAQLAAVNVSCHSFYGEWNYTTSPKRNKWLGAN
jgi:hypothetical protein